MTLRNPPSGPAVRLAGASPAEATIGPVINAVAATTPIGAPVAVAYPASVLAQINATLVPNGGPNATGTLEVLFTPSDGGPAVVVASEPFNGTTQTTYSLLPQALDLPKAGSLQPRVVATTGANIINAKAQLQGLTFL